MNHVNIYDYFAYYTIFDIQGNVFQTVIITDGSRTYSMFNYKPGGIHSRLLGRNIRFGYQFRNFNNRGQVGHISGTESMQIIDQLQGNASKTKAIVIKNKKE